jgi:hypothetical protein
MLIGVSEVWHGTRIRDDVDKGMKGIGWGRSSSGDARWDMSPSLGGQS